MGTTQSFIITILGYLFGAGGLFAFIMQMRQTKHTESQDAVTNWHELYESVRENVKTVEAENKTLRRELNDLQLKIVNLTAELESYKRFDTYVAEQEAYITTLLHVVKPLVADEAFKQLEASRPVRVHIKVDEATDEVMFDVEAAKQSQK